MGIIAVIVVVALVVGAIVWIVVAGASKRSGGARRGDAGSDGFVGGSSASSWFQTGAAWGTANAIMNRDSIPEGVHSGVDHADDAGSSASAGGDSGGGDGGGGDGGGGGGD